MQKLLLILHFYGRGNWDSSVDIATGCGLDFEASVPGRGKRFFILHSVHTGIGTCPASSPVGTMGSFPGGKAVGT
jgi:hypothetical protein